MSFIPAEIIQKKKLGKENSPEEISFMVQNFAHEKEVMPYHMSAWAMAIYFKGMSDQEISCLTQEMKNSGDVFDFSFLNAPRIDKHSTGGVGDKTSLIIGPIMAANEVYNPMIAGRGLGHTGGTLDKLESIKGFNVNLTTEQFYQNIKNYFFTIMGQTKNICPADKKLYALRDVTSTVDSLPLICGSIMSKKLAEDLSGLVLDVKYGSGAFMKSVAQAEDLAKLLKSTGQKNGVNVSAYITNMNQPLGAYIGNSLEVLECIEIMQGKTKVVNGRDFYEDTKELSVQLSGEMLYLAGKANSRQSGYELAQETLESGKAMEMFNLLCKYQSAESSTAFSVSEHTIEVKSPKAGFIQSMNTEKIGLLSVELGAGRLKAEDSIDHTVGIEIHAKVGDQVSENQTIATLYVKKEDLSQTNELITMYNKSIDISANSCENLKLVEKIIAD